MLWPQNHSHAIWKQNFVEAAASQYIKMKIQLFNKKNNNAIKTINATNQTMTIPIWNEADLENEFQSKSAADLLLAICLLQILNADLPVLGLCDRFLNCPC